MSVVHKFENGSTVPAYYYVRTEKDKQACFYYNLDDTTLTEFVPDLTNYTLMGTVSLALQDVDHYREVINMSDGVSDDLFTNVRVH